MINIIYEEEDFLILNKPSGIVVHPDAHHKADTLVDKLLAIRPEIKGVGESKERPGIVHRLDKGTSGVMVVAKNQETFKNLKKLFKERKVKKEYLALVYGRLKEKKGKIDFPIYRSPTHSPKREALRDETQRGNIKTKLRSALTYYEVQEEFKDFTLLKVYPKTGRTHQVRVHLAAIGHPVVGDELYKFKNLKVPQDLKRIFLHAARLSFKLKGTRYEFDAELPRVLENFLQKLSAANR